MPTKTRTSGTRTRMKKLPASQKELSREQKKRVKGGTVPTGTVVFTVDGNRTASAGTGILRSTDSGKTWTL